MIYLWWQKHVANWPLNTTNMNEWMNLFGELIQNTWLTGMNQISTASLCSQNKRVLLLCQHLRAARAVVTLLLSANCFSFLLWYKLLWNIKTFQRELWRDLCSVSVGDSQSCTFLFKFLYVFLLFICLFIYFAPLSISMGSFYVVV